MASTTALEDLYAVTFHELRAPISSINGYASVMLTGELGRLADRQREPLERIQELCRKLTGLIGNLLTLAKTGVQWNQSSRQFIDVRQVLADITHSMQGEIRRKQIRLVQKISRQPVRFWADANELSQLYLNLLSNAIKFTPAHGRITVELSLRLNRLALMLADTGVGIPPEEQHRIFEAFHHVDHPEVGSGQGSGLGLAIVKRMVDSYRGEVKVFSRPGQGTRFVIALPVRPEKEILEEFLEETWTQAKETGRSLGLLLLQIKRARSDGGFLEFLEKILREHLRKEDRVFRLPQHMLLTVLVDVEAKKFVPLVERFERILHQAVERHRGAGKRSLPWRMVTVLVPKRGGSAASFLGLTRRRLGNAWGKQAR